MAPNDTPPPPPADAPVTPPPAVVPPVDGGNNPPPADPAAVVPPAATWWDGIKEEPIREFMKAKDYKTPDEAARAAWNLNRVNKAQPEFEAVLTGKATPEQEAKLYTMMGRPESPEKYDLKPADGIEIDPAMDKLGRELMFKAGVSQGKAKDMYDQWNKTVSENNKAALEQERIDNEAALANVAKEWGPDLEANKAAGQRVLQSLKLSDAEMKDVEKHIGVASVVKLLARIGKLSSEPGLKGGNEQTTDPNDYNSMTKEQAARRVEELTADKDFQAILLDKKNPSRPVNLAVWEGLNAKASAK